MYIDKVETMPRNGHRQYNKTSSTYSVCYIISGTNIVIEACLMNNVKRLVQTSSVDSVSPLRDCVDEDEDSLPYLPESELAMPEYASTKMKAEKLVLGSHGRPLADGRDSLNLQGLVFFFYTFASFTDQKKISPEIPDFLLDKLFG